MYHLRRSSSQPQVPTTGLVCARLGYLLTHALVASGRDHIGNEILSCTDDVMLVDLAKHYGDHLLICYFETTHDATHVSSEDCSSPSSDKVQETSGYSHREKHHGRQNSRPSLVMNIAASSMGVTSGGATKKTPKQSAGLQRLPPRAFEWSPLRLFIFSLQRNDFW
ncbi:uncharacterized protein EDB91DRAFT_138012 [Suillus paluster]|uniref:uncharacterized protein n=1 Tax=Suillus paluster TaxID=48578 RepID=UPI001B863284|nr:uncharacterized protein EDB91DRAFT_784767 [Suillus paluster]XP_041179708.1 uncharacterized protein EDB91DRAFT_138012 [Suillus paluster]KAG1717727.1 hypothetical protein EDB91DRAFT_784767 [Suillus paluster]KAG1746007.1 hypothetical protein EDB91DRAFT_138012 [Suillus paluster]